MKGFTEINKIDTLLRSRIPLSAVKTFEENRFLRFVKPIIDDINKTKKEKNPKARNTVIRVYSCVFGLRELNNLNTIDEKTRDPMALIEKLMELDEDGVYILLDFHIFLDPSNPHYSGEIPRGMRELARIFESLRKNIIFVSPDIKLPLELTKSVTVVELPLPSEKELSIIYNALWNRWKGELNLKKKKEEMVINALKGLTETEARNTLFTSIVEHKKFSIEHIIEEKKGLIADSKALEFYHPNITLADIGGYELIKEYILEIKACHTKKAKKSGIEQVDGILLFGISGTGKSINKNSDILYIEDDMIKSETIENMYKIFKEGKEIEVIALNKDFKTEFKKISNVTRHYTNEPLIRMKTRAGRIIKATKDHSFVSLDDMGNLVSIRGNDLNIGDCIPLIKEFKFLYNDNHKTIPINYTPKTLTSHPVNIIPMVLNWENGFLMGAYISEGCIGISKETSMTLYISNMDNEFRNECFTALKKLGLRPNEYKEKRVSACSIAFSTFMMNECGRGARNKKLPSFWSKSNYNFRLGLLTGLFAGDGGISITKREKKNDGITVDYTSKSKELRDGYNLLLNSFGIPTMFRTKIITKGIYKGNKYYTATIPSGYIIQFCNLLVNKIPHKNKRERLRYIINNLSKYRTQDSIDLIPLTTFGCSSISKEVKNLQKRDTKTRKLISSLRGKCFSKHSGRRTLRILINNLLLNRPDIKESTYISNLRNLIDSDIIWDRIISIEEIQYNDYVYDLSVPNLENFALSNGIIVHNSLICKAIGSIMGLPLIRLNMGALFGGIVGETESNFRLAKQRINSIKPCVIWIDEIEKALGSSDGVRDGGVNERLRGEVLTWLQEETDDVLVVATANDIRKLENNPELIRSGRFSDLFFLDLPTPKERYQIFIIHLKKRGKRINFKDIDISELVNISNGYSGAEIEEIIKKGNRLAWVDGERKSITNDYVKAIKEKVPLSITMAEQIDALQRWFKSGRAKASSIQTKEVKNEIELDLDINFNEV